MSGLRRSLVAGGVGLILVVAATATANAQTPFASDAEDHVRRGLDLRRSGDDAAALAEFERAEELGPAPRVRAQIGLALQALGRWREAEEVQLQVLADHSDPWVHEHADVLRESLAAVQQHLSWLSVECNVAGAELLVNGTASGTLPLQKPVRVIAGALVVEVRARGYRTIRRTIDVPPGERAREAVVLVADAPAADVVTTPAPLAAWSDPSPVRRAVGWTTIVSGGVFVAGGVAATIAYSLYAAKYNDDSQCLVVPGLRRDQQCGAELGTLHTTLVAAVASFALGGLAAGAGVYLLATSSSRTAGRSAAIACGLGAASFACTGRF
jgi:hypothetical protein